MIPADVDDGLAVVEHRVPVDGATISVWQYRTPGAAASPAHVFFHAGGFCSGGPRQLDQLLRGYDVQAGCTLLSVDYRLAPEHPWPVAVEDGYAALAWTVEHAAELGVDPDCVSVGGVSAGGCIAAVVALLARDRNGPALVFQLLEIPITDVTMSCPSVEQFANGYLLTRADLVEMCDLYVPDTALRTNGYASPLLAEDLSSLPPAMVITAQYDPLRDEGEAYARRLREAGVPTQLIRARGHIHSSTLSAMKSARRYQHAAAAALARAYAD